MLSRNAVRGHGLLERGLRYAALAALLVLVAGLLAGCGKATDKEDDDPFDTPPPAPEPDKNIPYLPEDYTAFDGPRLQFISRHPKENHDSIWTVKPDGSDLRKTLSWAELQAMHMERGFNPPVIRSPDNRYIALAYSPERVIVDLLKKEKIVMESGGYQPSFQWTQDSKKVVFYMNGGMWEYTLASRRLEPRKVIYSEGFALIDGDRKIFAEEKGSFAFYTYAGELIRRVKLTQVPVYWAVSGSGRWLAYHYEFGGRGVAEPTTKMLEVVDTGSSKAVRTLENQYWKPIGFSKDETAVYLSGFNTVKYDLKTGAVQELFPAQQIHMIGITLINNK